MLYTPQFYISVGCAQWIGARRRQEDCISAGVADGGQQLLVLLADGMGGEEDGHLAAECVTQNFESEYFSSFNSSSLPCNERLHQSLLLANIALGKKKKARHIDADAGCTLIALATGQDGLCWLSVGDSLLYRQYGDGVEKLNTAHTWEWELARRVVKGTMTAEEAVACPILPHALFSAVVGENTIAEVERSTIHPCRIGERYIIASDGLQPLIDHEWESLLSASGMKEATSQQAADKLMEALKTLQHREQDNASIIVLDILPPRPAPAATAASSPVPGGSIAKHLIAMGILLILCLCLWLWIMG